jgi:hypothetical protein
MKSLACLGLSWLVVFSWFVYVNLLVNNWVIREVTSPAEGNVDALIGGKLVDGDRG